MTVALRQALASAWAQIQERSDAFAGEVRALFARLELDRVRFAVAGNVIWGRPR